jgi:hypothetical protein
MNAYWQRQAMRCCANRMTGPCGNLPVAVESADNHSALMIVFTDETSFPARSRG